MDYENIQEEFLKEMDRDRDSTVDTSTLTEMELDIFGDSSNESFEHKEVAATEEKDQQHDYHHNEKQKQVQNTFAMELEKRLNNTKSLTGNNTTEQNPNMFVLEFENETLSNTKARLRKTEPMFEFETIPLGQ